MTRILKTLKNIENYMFFTKRLDKTNKKTYKMFINYHLSVKTLVVVPYARK